MIPTPASPLSSVADRRSRRMLRLRPGGRVFEISPEQLQISFPNHTATFQGAPVAKGLRALMPLLESGGQKSELAAAASEHSGLQPTFLEYLLDLLSNSNCLYEAPEATDTPLTGEPLAEFYASLGQDPAQNLATLAAARPVIAAPVSRRDSLSQALRAGGLSAEVVDIRPGTSCEAALAPIRALPGGSTTFLIGWDFPYRSPFARLLNDLALELSTPVLFGGCEGLTGRIGPYIIPRNTPCLECFNSRILANSGVQERTAYAECRARDTDSVAAPWPAHPLFHDAIERLFVLELSQILLGLPPRTIGGVVEYGFADGSTVRRPVYKVPRCEACYPAKPPRIPWNVKFPAPVVKGRGA
jgi:bacteriocin biosynthesis cyclodehydratase domain-containing protein